MQHSIVFITLAAFTTTFVMAQEGNKTIGNDTNGNNDTTTTSATDLAGTLRLGTAGTIGALAAGAIALIIWVGEESRLKEKKVQGGVGEST